mgnify:CR=1 FL=1
MAKSHDSHVLQNEEQVAAIVKRIKRAQGQLGAVAQIGRAHV